MKLVNSIVYNFKFISINRNFWETKRGEKRKRVLCFFVGYIPCFLDRLYFIFVVLI